MPANVDQMFSVRQVPWHREGTVTAEYPETFDAARRLAGLDWDPVEAPAFEIGNPDKTREIFAAILEDSAGTRDQLLDALVAAVPNVLVQTPGWKRIVRSDSPATIACVKAGYPILTHDEFGEIFEAVLQQDKDRLRYETGGVLEGGAKVWMLVALDEPVEIKGDGTVTMPYLALTTRHDAQGGTVLRATAVRIVCANTFRAAELEGEQTGATFKFRHSRTWREHMEDARAAITGARREMREYAEMMGDLLKIRISGPQAEWWLERFIPKPPEGIISDRVSKNVDDAREAVRKILASPTVDGAGISGTVYGLLQAGGEYLDHVRAARSWETRLNRAVLRPERQKTRALTLALEAAKQ